MLLECAVDELKQDCVAGLWLIVSNEECVLRQVFRVLILIGVLGVQLNYSNSIRNHSGSIPIG